VGKQTYGILYTGYAIPNLFIPIFAGALFDKIGSRNGILIFTVLLCLGQFIFMLGGYHLSFNLMIIGRIIFGIGCESMYVGQSAIISEWFMNYELPFAMSMVSCLPLIGSFVGGAMVPRVFYHELMVKTGKHKPNKDDASHAFGVCFRLGLNVCLICFCLVLLIYYLDLKTE
jgi:MFS family permease